MDFVAQYPSASARHDISKPWGRFGRFPFPEIATPGMKRREKRQCGCRLQREKLSDRLAQRESASKVQMEKRIVQTQMLASR